MRVEVASPILEEYKVNKELHEELCEKIQGLLIDILKTNHINCHSIDSRVKEENSLVAKVKKGGSKYSNLNDITDISGIRVITYFSDDVDKIAKVIQDEFEVDEVNSVDKREILDPDRFGYLSLHYVIKLNDKRISLPEYKRFKDLKIEIQIRSILQHAWAEIEHDLGYKSKHSVPRKVRRNFSRLASLLELADEEFDKIREMLIDYKQTIKEEIRNEPANVLLDIETLKRLISEKNSIVARIDAKICEVTNSKIIQSDLHNLEEELERLRHFGFNTIDKVLNSLEENEDTIVEFSDIWVNIIQKDDLGEGSFSKGISLFYLAYVLLAKTGSIKEINTYAGKFIDASYAENETFAIEILSAFDQSK